MNQDLQELIEAATRLSDRLERMAQNEKLFSDEICQFLEKSSWEMYRFSEDIERIKGWML